MGVTQERYSRLNNCYRLCNTTASETAQKFLEVILVDAKKEI